MRDDSSDEEELDVVAEGRYQQRAASQPAKQKLRTLNAALAKALAEGYQYFLSDVSS